MFQQNDNGRYEVYRSNKVTITRESTLPWPVIIGCIIFTLICATITGIAIWYRISMDANYAEQRSIERLKQDMEKMKISGLSERYSLNDLDAIYSIEHIGPSRDNMLSQDENTTKLTIKYMAIKGLKNKDVENEINTTIGREMVKLYTNTEIDNPNIDYINISGNIAGNYANILSIYLIKYTKETGNSSGKRVGKSLNFDLTTGNEIKFEDLFLPGVSIKNILTQVVYDNLAQKQTEQNIEEKVYQVIDKYEQGKIDGFYFDSSKVCFAIDGKWYVFSMWKFYDKIGIYKRFKTANSIFDGTHEKQGEDFVFQEIREEVLNTKISNNFITIIVTPYNLKSKSEHFINKFNEYYDAIKIKAQQLKNAANVDQDQTIIYACKIDMEDINNYWSFYGTDQNVTVEKKTDFLKEFEVCEVSKNECVIKISNDYFENELLKEMYGRNFTEEKFANITQEELFAWVGGKGKLEKTSEDKTIIELVTNEPIETIIEKQFKKQTDEIKGLLQTASSEDDLNKIKAKTEELKENIEIMEGKFFNDNNDKIKAIDTENIKELENIDNSIYNINLKNEIIETFDKDIKDLSADKSGDNLEAVEEQASYLLQKLNAYYPRNKNNDSTINRIISDYSKEIIDVQNWVLRTRQEKLEEEKRKQEEEERKRQNSINNNITNNTNTTNKNNNTNNNNITNKTNSNNTTNTTSNSNLIGNNTINSVNDYQIDFNTIEVIDNTLYDMYEIEY